MLDGRLMLDLIAECTFGASAAELQRRETAFKTKVYFKDSLMLISLILSRGNTLGRSKASLSLASGHP